MKHLVLHAVIAFFLPGLAGAQCIMDIQYLEDSPLPCHFIGTVNPGSAQCANLFANPAWKYVWKIKGANGGDLIATYEGFAFDHVFEKFGGYDFFLEIHWDGNSSTPPDHVERQTYTTCEPCGGSELVFDFVDCPFEVGCNLEFATKIEAVNMVGLKPTAKYIVSYEPTPQELLGGAEPYDIVFPDVQVQFHPDSGQISVAEDLNITFRRGCYRPRLELQLEFGAGAHNQFGGAPCTKVAVETEQVFRCIACTNPKNDCEVNIAATEVSNEEGTCDLISCWGRSAESETEPTIDFSTEFRLSPNPASHLLRVEMPETGHDNLTLFLMDAMGKIVETQQLENGSDTNLDVSNHWPGMYFVAIRADGEMIHSDKVLIRH